MDCDIAHLQQEELPPIPKDIFFSQDSKKKSLDLFFQPWGDMSFLSFEALKKEMTSPQKLFGPNLLPFKEMGEIFKNIQQGIEVRKKGITLKTTMWRALPFSAPLFGNPKKAGEGYPYDCLQYGRLSPHRPVYIVGYSKDNIWALIYIDGAYGWVLKNDIAIVNDENEKFLRSLSIGVMIKDHTPFFDEHYICHLYTGNWLFHKNGKIIWLNKEGDGFAYKFLDIAHFSKEFLKPTQQNIEMLFSDLSKCPYLWGGSYYGRDCSHHTKDFLACFGIFLYRNSKRQVAQFESFDFKNQDFFKLKAKPYQTLVTSPGHIVLYVGCNKKGKPIVWHSKGGIKTKQNTQRFTVAKCVVTGLDYWKLVPDGDQLEYHKFNFIK
jgi:hypothetical protein